MGVFIFGLGVQIILARTLGPEGKGTFSLAILTATLLFAIFNLSLGQANSHFIGRRSEWAASIFGNSLLISFLIGVSMIALYHIFSESILTILLPKVNPDLAVRTVMILPFLLLLEYMNNIVLGQDRITRLSIILAGREIILFIVLIAVSITGYISIETAIWCWIAVSVSIALYSFWSAGHWTKFRISLSWTVFKSMRRFFFQAHLANLSTFIRMRADLFIIGYFLNVYDVGIFNTAVALTAILWYLPASVAQVLIPYISHRENCAGDLATPKLCRMTLFINLIAGIGLGLFGWVGIRLLFGSNFLPAFPILLILIPGAVVMSLAKLLSGDLGGRGKPQYAMYISITAMILSVVGNFLLIPRFHLAGAAITASVTSAINGILFLFAFQRESKVSLINTVIIQKDDFKVIMAIIMKKLS